MWEAISDEVFEVGEVVFQGLGGEGVSAFGTGSGGVVAGEGVLAVGAEAVLRLVEHLDEFQELSAGPFDFGVSVVACWSGFASATAQPGLDVRKLG